MKWRPVYMKIDYAHAGIPEYIADSPTELAALCGVGLSTISHSLATQKRNHAPERFTLASGHGGVMRSTKRIL